MAKGAHKKPVSAAPHSTTGPAARYSDRVRLSIKQGKYAIPHEPQLLRELIFRQEPRLIEIAQEVTQLVRSLEPAGEGLVPDVRIVGGFVRDSMIGLTPKDIDLEVYGVEPTLLEATLKARFGDALEKVGKSFEVLKLNIAEDLMIDITIPRSGTFEERVDFTSGDPTLTIKEAAELRDFSMNNLAADAITGEITDSWMGLPDMRERRLRITNPSIFCNNPFQVFRGVQFSARLELLPAEETFTVMRNLVLEGKLSGYPEVRVTDEFLKLLLKAHRPSIGLELMRQLGMFEQLFAEFKRDLGASDSVETLPDGLWQRTLLRVDRIAGLLKKHAATLTDDRDRYALIFAALCYDLTEESTRSFLDKLAFPKSTNTAIIACKQLHRSYIEIYQKNQRAARKSSSSNTPTPPATHRRVGGVVRMPFRPQEKSPTLQMKEDFELLLQESSPCSPQALMIFDALIQTESTNAADRKIAPKALAEFRKFLEKTDVAEIAKRTLISKYDLINEIGLKSGPQLGFVIGEIEKLRSSLITKARAIEYLKKHQAEILMRAEELSKSLDKDHELIPECEAQ